MYPFELDYVLEKREEIERETLGFTLLHQSLQHIMLPDH